MKHLSLSLLKKWQAPDKMIKWLENRIHLEIPKLMKILYDYNQCWHAWLNFHIKKYEFEKITEKDKLINDFFPNFIKFILIAAIVIISIMIIKLFI